MTLQLEHKDQEAGGIIAGGLGMITPNLDEDYWSYRVVLHEGQAVLGFPKFGTIGIGFAVEDADWNRNLPYQAGTEEIVDWIWENAGEGVERQDVLEAVALIQAAAIKDAS